MKDYGNILQFVRSGKYLLDLKILKVSFAMFKLFVNISPWPRPGLTLNAEDVCMRLSNNFTGFKESMYRIVPQKVPSECS